jgi:peroxiredoxin
MKGGAYFLVVLFCVLLQGGEGAKAPSFRLKTPQGQWVESSEWLGKGPVLINFWATWCSPCLREMKQLAIIHKDLQERGLTIVSIAIDDQKTVAQVPGVVRSRKFPFLILLDTDQSVFRQFQGTVPPYNILLNRDGVMVYKHEGYRPGDEQTLRDQIMALLQTP